jgi:hypothetical protein
LGLYPAANNCGFWVAVTIVKKSSPVAWYNINFKGIYLFDDKKNIPSMKELMKTIDGYQPV